MKSELNLLSGTTVRNGKTILSRTRLYSFRDKTYRITKIFKAGYTFYRLNQTQDAMNIYPCMTIDNLDEWGFDMSWASAERKVEKELIRWHAVIDGINQMIKSSNIKAALTPEHNWRNEERNDL